MEVSYQTIGSNIKKARKVLRMTQAEIAERLGMSVLHYGRLERGERRVSFAQLARVADVLHVSFYDLLAGAVFSDRAALRKMIASYSAEVSEEDMKLAEALYHVVKTYKG